jgi:MinD superfamily P-loop ATPase
MKQVVIISGKGGTGKTVITAAFAVLAENKVIVDCDVDAANLHLLLNPRIKEKFEFKGMPRAVINQDKCTGCGECARVCRYDAIIPQSSSYTVNKFSCEGCRVCMYVCPAEAIRMEENIAGEWYISETKYGPMVHAKLGITEENSGKLVTRIREEARVIAEKEKRDYVIIDGPPGIGCPVIASIAGVDIVLIVTEPTLSGIHDMVRAVELTKHFKIKTFVVINKYDLNIGMTEEIEKYCQENKIPLAGKIVYDPIVTEAVVNKKPVVEYSDGEVVRQIKDIWKTTYNELKSL